MINVYYDGACPKWVKDIYHYESFLVVQEKRYIGLILMVKRSDCLKLASTLKKC